MLMQSLSSIAFAAALILGTAHGADAAASDPVEAGQAKVRLLAGGNLSADGKTNSAPVLRGGLEIVLTRGWKTYWRYPGDAGIPPRFDWSGSENVAEVEVLYPAPKRLPDGTGQISIGYEDRVLFPLRIRAADPAKPVTLNLKFDFATCEKICIPADAKLSLTVPADAQPEAALDNAEARVPARGKLGDTNPPSIVSVTLDRGKAPGLKDARILVTVAANSEMLDLFAEGPSDEWTLALPQRIDHTGNFPTFAIPLDGARLGKAAVPSTLRLTLTTGTTAIAVEAPLD